MSDRKPLLGGVEMGGTKCVCLLGTGRDDIRAQHSIPTGSDSAATLAHIEQTLQSWRATHGPMAALGVACFGPLDLAPRSDTYGFITTTTKLGWRNTDVARRLARAVGVPVGFNTDVNGAALAEGRWGAAQGLTDFAYVTVGTGIGVGLVVAGRPVYGFSHAELGHIRTVRSPGDQWPGACAFHGDCLEGLASGAAIEQRLGTSASSLSSDDPVWELVSDALGQLLHTLVLATAPRRILLGGGVMHAQRHLFERLRRALQRSLNHYIDAPQLGDCIADYIRPPELGELAGPLGSLALAQDALTATRGVATPA
ncbi:MAG TPA: ROK family protein [Steroidobacteraceae bacterium]